MGPDGTAGNVPRGTIIQANFAYRCGLFEKQSSFYFQAKSHANLIKDNIFVPATPIFSPILRVADLCTFRQFHGPRAGMNFNGESSNGLSHRWRLT